MSRIQKLPIVPWPAIAALLALAMVMAGCGAAPEANSSPAVADRVQSLGDGRVQVPAASEAFLERARVGSSTGRVVTRAPGRIEFRDGALYRVNAPVGGRIEQVHVALGDQVAAGDALVTISSPDAARIRAELRQAEVEVNSARAEVERQHNLLAREIGVERDLLQAEARFAEVEANLARAEIAAGFLGGGNGQSVTVTAPVAGIVLGRAGSPGAVADPSGDALVEIGDPDQLWVRAEVYEGDLGLIEAGARAEVEFGAAGTARGGTVTRIGSIVDQRLRRAPVYVTLDDSDPALRPGTFVRVRLVSEQVDGVMFPPSAVLITGDREHVVFVREEDGIYVRRPVQIGRTIDGRVQILSGLDEHEEVVVRGALLLERAADQLLF